MYPAACHAGIPSRAAPCAPRAAAARLARRLAGLAREGRRLALRTAQPAAAEPPALTVAAGPDRPAPALSAPAGRIAPRAARRPAAAARRAAGGKPGRPGRPGRRLPAHPRAAALPRDRQAMPFPPVPAPQDAPRPAFADSTALRPASPRAATC
jgi:hypothetical protein